MSNGPSQIQKIARKFEILLERMNGLDFSTVIPVAELGFDEALVKKGSPSGNKYLTNLLSDLNIQQNDKILDIGCAKGGVLRCMTKFPFKNIDGIEISDMLANIAVRNFQKLNEPRVNITNINATEFSHYADYDFLYLYNPFPESIMEKVLTLIQNQISSKKEVVIIYNNPVCHDQFESFGLCKITEYPDMWGNGIKIYSNIKKSRRFASEKCNKF